MLKMMLGWKVLVPMAGSVLAAWYFIAQDGNETTASVPVARSVDNAPSAPAPAESSLPTWPGLGTTTIIQSDGEPSTDNQDNNPQTLADPSEPVARYDDSTPGPDPSEQADSEDIARQALQDEDPEVRATAINRLTGVSAPDAIYTLGHALQDEDASNRRAVVESLRQLAYSGGDSAGQIRNLLRTAAEDPDPGVRDWARHTIEELEQLNNIN